MSMEIINIIRLYWQIQKYNNLFPTIHKMLDKAKYVTIRPTTKKTMVTVNVAAEYDLDLIGEAAAIQDAINDETVDTIVLENKGTPWLISEEIDLESNKTIIFEPGVVVRAESGSLLEENASLFNAFNVDNIRLIGQGEGENRPVLQMNREEYDEADARGDFEAQFNHVVELLGVDGYEVSGLKITGGGGDGIHIAGGTFRTPPEPGSGILPYSQDGLIENVISDDNRRQGLSIDSANNLIVRNSTFSNTGGTTEELPESGIDLEPTWDFESLQNIVIEDVTIDNNNGNGIQFALGNLDDDSADISVDVRNVDIKNIDPDRSAIFVAAGYIYEPPEELGELSPAEIRALPDAEFRGEPDRSSPESMINGTINIEDVTISNAESIENSLEPIDNSRVYIFVQNISGNQDDPNNLQVNFNNVDINDPTDISVETTPIFINGSADDRRPEIGNLSFNDVDIVGNYGPDVDVVFIELEDENANLNDISGDITVFNSGDGAIIDIDDNLPRENFSLTVTDGNASIDPITGAVELINPGFQDGLTGWNGNVANASVVQRSGDNSWVRLAPNARVGIVQDITGKITPGENYQISATAQVEDLGTYAAIGINYENEAGELQQFQTVDITSDTPQNFELELTVPEDFASAEIFAYKQEGSAVFVDDFVLTPVIELINPSFQDGLTGWNGNVGRASVVERSGDNSWVRLDSSLTGGIVQDITGKIIPGENYQISATAQVEDLGTYAAIGINYENEAGELQQFQNIDITSDTPQNFELGFTVPQDFATADIFIYKEEGSAVFVDDFVLTPV